MSNLFLIPIVNLSYLVAIFGVWHLWRLSARLLLVFILATATATCVHHVSSGHQTLSDFGALAKLICIWPLGLGSLVAFSQLPAHARRRHLPEFTKYINVAVLGNIAMMFFLDIGETLRGRFHRVNCIMLVVWLMQEMRRKDWATVRVDRLGLFQFNASPLAWVMCHAAYRLAMMTLPKFDTTRYLVLEPASLGTMVLLGRRWAKAKSWEEVMLWFGLADTLVAATVVFVSSVWTRIGVTVPTLVAEGGGHEAILDIGMTALHFVVASVALFHIVRNARRP